MNQKVCKKIRALIKKDFPNASSESLYMPTKFYTSSRNVVNATRPDCEETGREVESVSWVQSILLNTNHPHGAYKRMKKLVKQYDAKSLFHG